jgi:uncharacterized protein involved in outer membrane biogenesis
MKKIFSEKDSSYRGWSGFVAALCLATYTWGGFLWAPQALRAEIQATADALHSQVTIGEIRFNPFSFTAHLHDVKLAGAAGEPLLSVAKVRADLKLASLWRGGTVVNKVVLAEPRLRIVIAQDGSIDASQWFAGAKSAAARKAFIPRLWIESLTLSKATIDVIDRRAGRNAKLQLVPLDLSLRDFRTEAGHANVYELALHTGGTERLTASGKFTLQPLEVTGSLSAKALSARTIDQLLSRVLPIRLAEGSFDFTGSYQLALQPRLRWRLEIPAIVAGAVTVKERNSESTPPLQSARVELKGLQLQWPGRKLHLDTLMLTQVRLNVVREADGSLNLARWFERSIRVPMQHAAATGVPWNFAIKTIDWQQAHVAIDDELARSTAHFDLTPAHITLDNVSNAAGTKTAIRVATQLNGAGHIRLIGELGGEPWLASLQLDATDLSLLAFQPYVDEIATLALEEGTLGLTGKLTSSLPGKLPGWRFNGGARLDGLRAKLEGQDLLTFQSVSADGIDWRTQRLRVEKVIAQRPSARIAVDKQGQLNLTRVLRSRQAKPASAPERNADPLLRLALAAASEAGTVPSPSVARARLPVQIARIEVIDGAANVTDESVAPTFATAMTAISGSLTGVSSEHGARAKLRMNARIDAQVPVSVVAEMNLLAPTRFTDLTLSCRDLPVTKLDTYAAKFAGYHLAKGRLTMELTYHVADGKANANHHIVLQDFSLGAATFAPKADALPAAVAVSLLKNRDGSITLDLPVSGRSDESAFRLPVAAWQAFAGVVNDTSAAPFKTLGSAAGEGEELAYVEFVPGSAEIAPSEQAKINRLASALKERPEVRLEIPFAVALQDAVAVARAQLAARVPQTTQDLASLEDRAKKQLIRLLEQQHVKDVGSEAPEVEAVTGKTDLDARITQLERLLLEAYAPDATELSGLGRARAQAVESALIGATGLQSGRVVVVGDRRPRVAAGRVRLALGLSAANVPGP